MQHKNIFLFLTMLIIAVVMMAACTARPGAEPSVSDLPTTTANPNQPVSSDDPTATPEPEPTATGEVIITEATITDVQILLLESWPLQATVAIAGELGDGCTELEEISTEREGDTFFITVTTVRPAEAICTQQLRFFEENVPLEIAGLSAGTYTVDVNGVQEQFTLEQDNVLQPEPTDDPGAELSPEDRAALIRLTLERALVEQEIPDYGLLPDPNNVVLSSENIDASLVPELAGTSFVVMSPEEIQEKANEEGDFLFLRFDDIAVESADKVTVRLSNAWAVAADSGTGYLSGGGFAIEYTRGSDGWSGEITEAWIS